MNQAAIEELKKQVRGEVLLPSDSGYGEARSVYNAMIDRRPAVIVYSSGTEDAAACVRFAREHDVPLSIRGGGHSVSGNAACDGGVMLDMSSLKGIQIDTASRTDHALERMRPHLDDHLVAVWPVSLMKGALEENHA